MMNLYDAAIRGNLTSLKSLVRSGKNINKCNGSGLTALHLAVQHNRVECAEFLLECPNLQPNIQDHQNGWTPLHFAMAYRRVRCAVMLLKHLGVETLVFDKAGRSPFDLLYDETTIGSEGGSLYTWGEGSNCALGHGSTDSKAWPKLVRALEGRKVVDVSAAPYSIACVTSSGSCCTAGFGAGGRLGHGDEETQLLPTRILGALQKKKVTKVFVAHSHGAVITDEGHLYTFGDGEYGKLGYGNKESSSYPKRVRGVLEDKAVVSAALGRQHTLALTSRGELFSFGRGDRGQLGYLMAQGKEDMYCQTVPRQVVCVNSAIVKVAAGNVHTICATERNEAFLVGFGSHLPRRLSLLREKQSSNPSFAQLSSTPPGCFSTSPGMPSSPSLSSSPTTNAAFSTSPATTVSPTPSINPRLITSLVANGDTSLVVQGHLDAFLLSSEEIPSCEPTTPLTSSGNSIGGVGKAVPLSLSQPGTAGVLLPKKLPHLPGAKKPIISANINSNKDIMVTTDKGQLWKYGPQFEGGTSSWKIISYRRFSKIACNRGQYAGIVDDSFDFTVKLAPSSFTADISSMFDHSEHCDVTIVVNDIHTIPAHRAILASRCKYFESTLDPSVQSMGSGFFGEEISLPEVKINDVNKDILMIFLRYLYTDSFKDPKTGANPSPAEIKALLALARKYQMPCEPGTYLYKLLHDSVVRPNSEHSDKKKQHHLNKGQSTYVDDMKKLFEDETWTDVDLVSSDGVCMPCHKFILAGRSDVLKAMLSSGMYEARHSIITLPEVKAFNLIRLKEYFYGVFSAPGVGLGTDSMQTETSVSLKSSAGQDLSASGGQSKGLSLMTLVELCGLGNELMCEGLKEACEKLLVERIDEGNVLNLLMAADAYRAMQLRDACVKYFSRFLPHILSTGMLTSSLASSHPSLVEELEKLLEEEAKSQGVLAALSIGRNKKPASSTNPVPEGETDSPTKRGRSSSLHKSQENVVSPLKQQQPSAKERPPSPTKTSCTDEKEEALFTLDEDVPSSPRGQQQQQQQQIPTGSNPASTNKATSSTSISPDKKGANVVKPGSSPDASNNLKSSKDGTPKKATPSPKKPQQQQQGQQQTKAADAVSSSPLSIPESQQQGKRRRKRGKSQEESQAVTKPAAWGLKAQSASPGHSFLDIQKEQQQQHPRQPPQQQKQQQQQLQQQNKQQQSGPISPLKKSQEGIANPSPNLRESPSSVAVPLGHFLVKKDKEPAFSPSKRGGHKGLKSSQDKATTTPATQPPAPPAFKWNVESQATTNKPASLRAIQEEESARSGKPKGTPSNPPPKRQQPQHAQQPQQHLSPPPAAGIPIPTRWGQQPQQPQQPQHQPSPTKKSNPPLLGPKMPKVSLQAIRAEEERKVMEEKKRREKPIVQPLWLIQLEEEAMAELRRFYGKEELTQEEIEAAYKYK